MKERAKAQLKTDPFVMHSRAVASGVYFSSGDPEVVECFPEGLWGKVTCKTPAGEKITRDFCEPKSLSSRFEWN